MRPFPTRDFGLGTVDGHLVCETTIGFVAVRADRCFKLSVDVSDLPPWFTPALEVLETPLSRNGQVSMRRFRRKDEGYIYTSAWRVL